MLFKGVLSQILLTELLTNLRGSGWGGSIVWVRTFFFPTVFIELVHLILLGLNVLLGKVSINIVHDLVIRPPADTHTFFLPVAQVVGEGRKAMTETVNADLWQSDTRTDAIDGAD